MPKPQHADFAALSERPDCASYCAGQCDPLGAECWKRPRLHQIAEPARLADDLEDAGVQISDADRKALWMLIAVTLTAIACVVLAWAFAGGAQ